MIFLPGQTVAGLLAAQDGRCAVCGEILKGGKYGQAVDHCHATGHVRGVLCNRHNLLLGLAGDDPTILEAAAAYLRNPPARQFAVCPAEFLTSC